MKTHSKMTELLLTGLLGLAGGVLAAAPPDGGVPAAGPGATIKSPARRIPLFDGKPGAVDIFVPNALGGELPLKPVEEYDWPLDQRLVDFFIKSPFLLTQAVLPGMKKKQWGRIVNIGSEVFQKSVPNLSPYVAAKGAQVGFTPSLSTELSPFGVTVNIVAPGWIPNERHVSDPQEFKDVYLKMIPAGRWGEPADIGSAVLFFASEEASSCFRVWR